MDHPRVHPNAAPAAGNGDLEMDHAGLFPPLPTPGGRAPNSWVGNDANTLLVVATLTTTLTYQLGTSIPGGYWQQDTPGSSGGKQVMYRAGDPIMRDLHRHRYSTTQLHV
ncbi:hypothetical protein BAE44_0024948 [Dichanthelium oligosanthes]|uniref:PGG domain-containing protein n=1 Tax=Dichanthelium oligosanthes TaxID=888268 RepID=A0A1E5UMI2_9POAL|nr:hypothetical protein BAE44_0024948 [Dichanthelium oligosanthes]